MRKKGKALKIYRGEIYSVDFDPVCGSEQGGIRPAVVLQNNSGNRNATTVIVAPITSQDKPLLPTHVALPQTKGLREGSVLLLEQIRTVDRQRVGQRVAVLGILTMAKVDEALLVSLAVGSGKKPMKPTSSLKVLETEAMRRLTAENGHLGTETSIKVPSTNVITLCPICKSEYQNAGYRLLKRSTSRNTRDKCCKCSYRTGFDYEVVR